MGFRLRFGKACGRIGRVLYHIRTEEFVMKKKRGLKIALCVILVPVLLLAGYVAYVLLAYDRLPDNLPLEIMGNAGSEPVRWPESGAPYRLVSWNIGFGAYESDFGFFLDGGTESRARSRERLEANLARIGALLAAQDADLLLVQEIDIDGTRSHHVNELKALLDSFEGTALENWWQVFAQNYDSPYLILPLTQPHGANRAGLGTFSSFRIASALRRSLPIETGLTKFLDLDRCYSVCRIPAEGKELILYNLHLSAYTSDGTIADEQLRLLLADMQGEYEAGNWCVAGGDFNKDLLGDSSVYFGASDIEYTWAQPIPAEVFDGVDIALVAPLDEADPVPSCRNADGPYHEGQYVLTVDGFLVSPNVEVREARVVDAGFQYSDHNPVYMDFTLQ